MVIKIPLTSLVLVLPMIILSGESVTAPSDNNFIVKYGEIILTYISNESDPVQQIKDYKEIFDETSKNDNMYGTTAVMLGNLVKELVELYSENTDLKHIITNMPPAILNIPLEIAVYIYNQVTMQNLCASNEELPDDSTSYVVYSSSDKKETCLWKFNIEANGRYFAVQNLANNRYMFADAFDAHHQRRTISTVDETRSDKWQLAPYRNGTNNEYEIKNFKLQEYIMTTQDSPDVFVQKYSNCHEKLCQWQLIPARKLPSKKRQQMLSRLYDQYTGYSKVAEILLQHASNSETRISEYLNIFELMKKHNGFYSIAGSILDYNIEQLLKVHFDNVDLIKMEQYFRSLWTPMPWNRRIIIQNKGDGTFLCSTTNFIKNDNARMKAESKGCHWKLEIDSSGFFYRIKSFSEDHYLIALRDITLEDDRRNIAITSRKSITDKANWQLHHHKVPHHEVHIKNVFFDESLYSYKKFRPATIKEAKCEGRLCDWHIFVV